MIREDYRKLAILCFTAILLISQYDVIFDLTLSVLHTSFDLVLSTAHFVFEWIEFGLEELIEHIFHTTRQQTQAIVFYLMLSVAGYTAFRLYLKFYNFYRRLPTLALEMKIRYINLALFFWNQQSDDKKLKLIICALAGIALAIFWLFN